MTPRQARLALCSFLLLAAAVAVNALFLQPRPTIASRAVIERPLPRTATDRARNGSEAAKRPSSRGNATGEPAQRAAHRDAASARLDAVSADVGEGEDSETIRALQRELRQQGYGALVSDGVMRPVTRAAIMAYEHDKGLPLTGEASAALLKHVLLGGTETTGASAIARVVTSPRAVQIVRQVQELLAALAYQPGAADGQLGEATLRAIREFEMDKGLPAKGRISADLLIRLTEAAAAKATAAR